MFFVFEIGRTVFACFSSVDSKAFTRASNALIVRFTSGSEVNSPCFDFCFLICSFSSSISAMIAQNWNGDFLSVLLFDFVLLNCRTNFASLEIPGFRRTNACTPHSSQMKYRLPFLSTLNSRSAEQRKQGSLALIGRWGDTT